MRLTQLIFLLISGILLSSAIALLFYSYYFIYDTREIGMDIRVSDHSGLNLDTDAMHFGRATSPGIASRALTVNNYGKIPLNVVIKTAGPLSKWVYIKEPGFTLQSNSSKNVMLEVYVPKNVSYGDYSGKIKIFFKRRLF